MAGRIAYYGGIVTNGLVLALDAAKKDSYPGSGTVWRDISGNGNNGTLTNGPTFNSNNGGSIVFDGVDDYINCGNVLNNLTNISLECWVNLKPQNSQYNGLISKTLSNSDGWEIRTVTYTTTTTDVQFRYVGDFARTSANTLNNNTWYHLLATGKYGEQKMYVNGALTRSSSVNRTPNSNANDLTIGKLSYFSAYLSGNITGVKIYNRALSATEVLQNYNATKGRYGL